MQIINDACLHCNGCKPWRVFLHAYQAQKIRHPEADDPHFAATRAFSHYQRTDEAPDTVVNYCLDLLAPKQRHATLEQARTQSVPTGA